MEKIPGRIIFGGKFIQYDVEYGIKCHKYYGIIINNTKKPHVAIYNRMQIQYCRPLSCLFKKYYRNTYRLERSMCIIIFPNYV